MQRFFIITVSVTAFFLAPKKVQASWEPVPDPQVVKEIEPSTDQPLPAQLSLMTWNIQKAQGQTQWQQDFQNLAAGKQIVLLQEGVEEPFIVAALRSAASLGWFMARAFFLETDHKATGVITGASRNPWSETFLRSPGREPISNTPKMSLLTTYQMQDGSRLLVVNVHAINFTTLGPFQKQIDQITGLIRQWTGRVVLAGDFNTWSPNRTHYLRQMSSAAGLQEVAFGNDSRKLVLDHIFLRGCAAYGAEVHSEIESSDHFPLTTELLCAN